MGSLLARKKESRVTEQDKAVLQLKKQRDQLKQYSKKILVKLENERQITKQLLQKGQVSRAKLLLKKKRYQEQLLVKTENMLDNIEQMTHDLEFAQVEMKVLDGLKEGNTALKKMHQLVSLDDVERIMNETQDGIEKQQEMDMMLSGELTVEDEAAVLAEFDSLVAGDSSIIPSTSLDKLPSVPSDDFPAVSADVEQSATDDEKSHLQSKRVKVAA